jgi:hypothetical protein
VCDLNRREQSGETQENTQTQGFGVQQRHGSTALTTVNEQGCKQPGAAWTHGCTWPGEVRRDASICAAQSNQASNCVMLTRPLPATCRCSLGSEGRERLREWRCNAGREALRCS